MDTCICFDIDEPFDFLNQRIVKAKKVHKCCECGDEIKVGDKYEISAGKWDGDFSSYKTCLICKRIREDFFPCGYYFEMLDELLREHFGVGLRFIPMEDEDE